MITWTFEHPHGPCSAFHFYSLSPRTWVTWCAALIICPSSLRRHAALDNETQHTQIATAVYVQAWKRIWLLKLQTHEQWCDVLDDWYGEHPLDLKYEGNQIHRLQLPNADVETWSLWKCLAFLMSAVISIEETLFTSIGFVVFSANREMVEILNSHTVRFQRPTNQLQLQL